MAHVGGEATLARERGGEPGQKLIQLATIGAISDGRPDRRDRAIEPVASSARSRRQRRGPAGAPAGRAAGSRLRRQERSPASSHSQRPTAASVSRASSVPTAATTVTNRFDGAAPGGASSTRSGCRSSRPARAGRPAGGGRRARVAVHRQPTAANRAFPATVTVPARARRRPRPRSIRAAGSALELRKGLGLELGATGLVLGHARDGRGAARQPQVELPDQRAAQHDVGHHRERPQHARQHQDHGGGQAEAERPDHAGVPSE